MSISSISATSIPILTKWQQQQKTSARNSTDDGLAQLQQSLSADGSSATGASTGNTLNGTYNRYGGGIHTPTIASLLSDGTGSDNPSATPLNLLV